MRRSRRAQAYVEAGAEMLFPEAITELAMYRQFADAVQVPILSNITDLTQHRCLPPTNYAAPMSQWRSTRFQRFAP